MMWESYQDACVYQIIRWGDVVSIKGACDCPAQLPSWLEEQALTQPLASRIIAARLGAGEREALALALEMQATCVVLDDLPARRVAQALRITVIGSLGVLLHAKEVGYIDTIRPIIQAMQAADFRASEHVLAGVLAAARENIL